MKIIRERKFANGIVYALETHDGFPIEVTDTFLPYYTKDAAWCHHNRVIEDGDFGSRAERWMIGVSVMSGCPVGCKFCATGSLKRWRNITAEEIAEQVAFVVFKNTQVNAMDAMEFKINYTRMGEPFLNVDEVRGAVEIIEQGRPGTHHYISTIGVKGSDFSWMHDNMTLQLSLHSLDDARRDELIPFRNKMSIEELSRIRVATKNKITLNLTLAGKEDFDMERLRSLFDPDVFFIKLSPINPNAVSDANGMGTGYVQASQIT